MSDLFTFNTYGRQPLKEQVTPHKLSLLVLIHKYQLLRGKIPDEDIEDVVYFTEKEQRDFMLTLLELLQGSDIELKELRMKLQGIIKPALFDAFFEKLKEIHDDGLPTVREFFNSIINLVFSDSNETIEAVISKNSVVGFFIRRMLLAYNKLSFSQVIRFLEKNKYYYELYFPNIEPETDLGKSLTDSVMSLSGAGAPLTKSCLAQTFEGLQISDSGVGGFYSQKQAEYFIAQQALLLHQNENKALSPSKLQEKILDILKSNKDLAEAHFLSYLNSLRVKEYCTAVHNLYHYYDRNSKLTGTESTSTSKDKEELTRRYAALNLAALHFRFGHHGEAMASLIEAIHIAQEANDNICLQHALSWLQRFGEQGVAAMSHLIEKSIAKSEDLALPYLTSLGVQVLARHNAFVFNKPANVFQYLQYSDSLNCENFLSGMVHISYTQKASLWHIFGKSELSTMCSLLVLSLDNLESGISHNTELSCIALCNLAQKHAERGQYQIATDLLNHAKLRFPVNSQYSHHWMNYEQQITFDKMLYNRKFNLAEQAVVNLRVVDEQEAKLRNALLLCERGETTSAYKQLNDLLEACNNQTIDGQDLHFQCRVLMAMSQLCMNTGNHTTGLNHILDCITKAKSHHMSYFVAIASIQLAFIQKYMLTILTHGSLYDQARTLYCYCRCRVANINNKIEDQRNSVLLSGISMMDTVIDLFKRVEAQQRVKDCIYYQARLYNDIGNLAERNKCAFQFKQLDQQYPTLSRMTINAF
ncbi:hypothetical protein LOTGIDRAFT_238189 [Lottia gigantea]|uniref:Anaphase-promoting complex subunit 5 n=1 Tax=Lottia gigantea TaxID=225164 RepID=V4B247_LOTGI|nr:hypothetical protein LOTGIDRAFT_238189 [Lottia gigantea]ESP01711.1 hypothetical protein LOTGIDRAFT_238189 [Lottia gigantea]